MKKVNKKYLCCSGLLGFGIQLFSLILIIALFHWLGKRIPTSNIPYTTGDALSIISERYARGEINKNAYVNLRKDILN